VSSIDEDMSQDRCWLASCTLRCLWERIGLEAPKTAPFLALFRLSEGLAESEAPVMDAPLCYHRSLTSKHWGGDGPGSDYFGLCQRDMSEKRLDILFPDFTIHD
jgi:hypothetical protein